MGAETLIAGIIILSFGAGWFACRQFTLWILRRRITNGDKDWLAR